MVARPAFALLAVVLAAAPIATPAWAQMPSADEATFVTKASVGNNFEIAEARLALAKATDPRLKQFAQRMIHDHDSALAKLKAAAQKAGKPIDPALDKPHQAMLDNLKTFSGADFDKIYLADQIASHVETVSLLSDYVQNGKDAALKSWAKQSLPVVKGHLATVDAM